MTNVVRGVLGKRFVVLLVLLSLAAGTVGIVVSRNLANAAEPVQLPTFNIPPVSAEFEASEKPNVLVIATGGTIAGAARDRDKTNFQNYAAGTYTMADMVSQLPVHKTADVSTFQFGNKGSGSYTIKDLYDLSLAVDTALADY